MLGHPSLSLSHLFSLAGKFNILIFLLGHAEQNIYWLHIAPNLIDVILGTWSQGWAELSEIMFETVQYTSFNYGQKKSTLKKAKKENEN